MGRTLATYSAKRGPGELILEPYLTARGWASQYPVNVDEHTYILDFAKPDQKLCIEVDGASHALTYERDAGRTKLLVRDGWMMLRFWNREVENHLPEVLGAIWP